MHRYRIKVLHISIISNVRLFDVVAANSFEAGKIAAKTLFGIPFITEDFECKKLWFRKNYLITHKRMDSLKAEFKIKFIH